VAAVHGDVVRKLPEVPSVAALPADDARPSDHAAWPAGSRTRADRPADRDLRPRAAAVLPLAVARGPRVGDLRGDALRPALSLAGRPWPIRGAGELRALLAVCLPDVARHTLDPVPALRLVRQAEA